MRRNPLVYDQAALTLMDWGFFAAGCCGVVAFGLTVFAAFVK
jgi:hypothetical protein